MRFCFGFGVPNFALTRQCLRRETAQTLVGASVANDLLSAWLGAPSPCILLLSPRCKYSFEVRRVAGVLEDTFGNIHPRLRTSRPDVRHRVEGIGVMERSGFHAHDL